MGSKSKTKNLSLNITYRDLLEMLLVVIEITPNGIAMTTNK